MIEQVTIANYRSFGKSTTLDLAPFSVFIGPNAAGKSNFVDIFRFLQESVVNGIEPAVARRLGWTNLRCRRCRNKSISMSIHGKPTRELVLGHSKQTTSFSEAEYTYELAFSSNASGIVITHESAKLHGRTRKLSGRNDKSLNGQRGEANSEFVRTEERVSVKERVDPGAEESTVRSVLKANRARLFTSTSFMSLAALVVNGEIERWKFHDPSPQLIRQPQLVQDVGGISESGDTLALVLHRLRNVAGDESNREQAILSLTHTLIPGFENWETEQLADGRIAFKVRETGLRGTLPASLLSDGTVRLLAILAALLLPEGAPSAIFIEEPERSLHPSVLATLVDVMRQVAIKTQIIVTTHSADFVRHCHPEEVYMMDKVRGFTQIVQANTIEQIDEFLKHFTLDQLWLQGHLERGIP